MKTVGLITEYNPFHKGHEYQIEEAKKQTGAELAIAVMSGNYVQRGMPAFLDKYSRTEIALKHGIDLVIELPLIFAVGSAEIFAQGAVSILDKIGITDYLCFGTEETDKNKLLTVARLLAEEPAEFQESLRKNLKKGASFPAARTEALLALLSDFDSISFRQMLNQPNNILAVEYLKALIQRNSRITPLCIPRIHSGYHDTASENRFFSASAIRSIKNPETLLLTLKQIDSAYESCFHISCPIQAEDFDSILGIQLLSACANSNLSDFLDMNTDLEHTIRKKLSGYTGFQAFAKALKSKNLTYSRICRCLLHIMLDIHTDFVKNALLYSQPNYIRILGFTKKGSELLGRINPDIALITKTAGYEKQLANSSDKKTFEINLHADKIYRMAVMNKYKHMLSDEFTQKLIVI